MRPDEASSAAWRRLVESHAAWSQANMDFLADGVDRVGVLRAALRGPDRMTGILIAPCLKEEERKELFPEWVNLARAAHGPVAAVRQIIASLPHDWVLAHIEPEVEKILVNEEYDDYWLFLELYEQLDTDLTLKLARRAAAHLDPDIREMGEDYLERL